MRIEIDPEFEALIPPLTKEEFDQLEASILKEGMRDPIVVWDPDPWGRGDTAFILDGHNRFKIWLKNNLVPKHKPQDYGILYTTTAGFDSEIPDREAALLWIEENQVGRRNLNDDQRAVMWESIRERRSKIARAEQLAQARDAKENPSVSVKTTETEKRDTRKEVAKESGLPESKLRAAHEVKKANPEVAEQVRQGKKTLRQAKREMKPAPAEATKPRDAEWRWRKVDSLVSNLYGELPVEQRAKEVRVLAERLRGKYLSLPNVSEEAA